MVDTAHASVENVPVLYPLDPLTASEIAKTTRIIRMHGKLSPRFRFISVTLHEPSKELVRLSSLAMHSLGRQKSS